LSRLPDLPLFDLTPERISSLLPARPADSHKGNYGKLVLVCGGRGYAGAAALATRSALRGGCGLTTACVPLSVYPVVASSANPAIVLPLAETPEGYLSPAVFEDGRFLSCLSSADAFTLGCGLLPGDTAKELLCRLLSTGKKAVIDAGMLNFLSTRHNFPDGEHIVLGEASLHPGVILTPHMGELSRILGYTPAHTPKEARRIAKTGGCVLVMKGHRTLIASPDGRVARNTTGNPGMAKGGSGDVLAGLIGSLACLLPAFEAACLGVYLHGLAGDRAASDYGENGMTPEDMIDRLRH